ncbi:MAG: TIGR00270 family protein [Candidatus Bathyarchaeota archaeon]|nr:MAG: TIGR00270 family protein [Candidatus Bathyarchaeota archaeon]
MDCEVCGSQIYGRRRSIVIDGAKLIVCSNCAQSSHPSSQSLLTSTQSQKKRTLSSRIPSQTRPRASRSPIHEDTELRKNYGSIIRKGRETMRLTHEELSRTIGEKISLLQKLETEKMIPDLNITRKLEHTLKIKLFEPPSTISIEDKFTSKPTGLTLGDLISLRQKSDESEDQG